MAWPRKGLNIIGKMERRDRTIGTVADDLAAKRVAFIIPSYGEGEGIVPTLRSLWLGMRALSLDRAPIILSDSSPAPTTVNAAQSWANSSGAQVVVDRSEKRRSQKEALNVALDIALDRCSADIVVTTNADVIVPPRSLTALIGELLCEESVIAAVGSALPDPTYRGLGRAAAAWQLRLVQRTARLQPREECRSQGGFWAARASFLRTFRYALGEGSVADDIQLSGTLKSGGHRTRNAANAFVYVVPASGSRDFALATNRFRYASESEPADPFIYLAALIEGVLHPIGAALYCTYRLRAHAMRHALRDGTESETWEVSASTKR